MEIVDVFTHRESGRTWSTARYAPYSEDGEAGCLCQIWNFWALNINKKATRFTIITLRSLLDSSFSDLLCKGSGVILGEIVDLLQRTKLPGQHHRGLEDVTSHCPWLERDFFVSMWVDVTEDLFIFLNPHHIWALVNLLDVFTSTKPGRRKGIWHTRGLQVCRSWFPQLLNDQEVWHLTDTDVVVQKSQQLDDKWSSFHQNHHHFLKNLKVNDGRGQFS